MALRPEQTHWFEVYVPRDQTVYALEALASTGTVELELDPRLTVPLDVRDVREQLRLFDAQAAPYLPALPDTELCPTTLAGDPEDAASEATAILQRWAGQWDVMSERLQGLERELKQLELIEEYCRVVSDEAESPASFGHRTDFLYKGVFVCPWDARPEDGMQTPVQAVHLGPEHKFLAVAALPESGGTLQSAAAEAGCDLLVMPEWLEGDLDTQCAALRERRQHLEQEHAAVVRECEALRNDHRLLGALANIALLRWYVEHARSLGTVERLCHLTGWTDEASAQGLQSVLDHAGVRGIVRFSQPPLDVSEPVGWHHGWWGRPFEAFVRLWGTPGRKEVDPTGLLPLVVPLLFGYMFPDLGHGLLLVVLSLALAGRWPQLRMLVPCGISAMIFGLLFGDVFGFHDLVPALWLRPLDHPLPVLLVPLAFGAVLVLLGLVFDGVESLWRGELRRWLLVGAPVLGLYPAIALTLLEPWFWPSVVLFVVWYFVGILWICGGAPLRALGAGIGRLLHGVFELAMHTLSFARVGAFALAHAGLSAAVMQLAASVENRVGWLLVVLVGNILAVALEGLVVFVQTTRLVLFEFFLRFLRAEGRVFRPIGRADAHVVGQGEKRGGMT